MATGRERILGTLSFNGQHCTAIKIVFVHREIAEAFLDRFAEAIAALKFGMPWEEGVFVTPLPEAGKSVEPNRDLIRRITREGCSHFLSTNFLL